MEKSEFEQLKKGIYRIWWIQSSGNTLVAIGRNEKGEIWIANPEWPSVKTNYEEILERIAKVTLVYNSEDKPERKPHPLHKYQQRLLDLSKEEDISKMSLREIGKKIGVGHQQMVVHHLKRLWQKGLIKKPFERWSE